MTYNEVLSPRVSGKNTSVASGATAVLCTILAATAAIALSTGRGYLIEVKLTGMSSDGTAMAARYATWVAGGSPPSWSSNLTAMGGAPTTGTLSIGVDGNNDIQVKWHNTQGVGVTHDVAVECEVTLFGT